MKKNGTMRVAALLLALTLISSCFVGSTFAKYVTSTTTTDSVRVAYWGFKAASNKTATDFNLFDGEYAKTDASYTLGDNTVVAETVLDDEGNEVQDNVIAPGTSKTATFSFVYNGNANSKVNAPEVAYTFTVDVEWTDNLAELDANPNFVWTLKNNVEEGEATHYSETFDTFDQLAAAIEALDGEIMAGYGKVYAPGTLPTYFTEADEEWTVGWEWKFDNNDADGIVDDGTADEGIANNGIDDQDDYDTMMGNMETLENLTFTITITAEQID